MKPLIRSKRLVWGHSHVTRARDWIILFPLDRRGGGDHSADQTAETVIPYGGNLPLSDVGDDRSLCRFIFIRVESFVERNIILRRDRIGVSLIGGYFDDGQIHNDRHMVELGRA